MDIVSRTSLPLSILITDYICIVNYTTLQYEENKRPNLWLNSVFSLKAPFGMGGMGKCRNRKSTRIS
jgi:hypothetical protein